MAGEEQGASLAGTSSLAAEDKLLRRVPRRLVASDGQGGYRPGSGVFKERGSETGVSVYVESILRTLGFEPDDVLEGHDEFFLVSVTIGFVTTLELTVRLAPEDDTSKFSQAHALIAGRITESKIQKLAAAAERRKWPAPGELG